jgi:hypothetical protein
MFRGQSASFRSRRRRRVEDEDQNDKYRLFLQASTSSVECRMVGEAVFARHDRVMAVHNGTTEALDS